METLSKFGVPMGGGTGRGGILQPKYKYRWRCRFVNFGPLTGGLDISQNIQTIDRPKVSHQEIEVHAYNSISWYAGKHQWDSISMVVRDDVNNSVMRLVGHQMQKQLNHFEQTGFLSGINYKFTALLEVMDGGNDGVLEAWNLEGCWIQNLDFDTMDYTAGSDILLINMTIRFDNATMAGGLMPTATTSGGTVGGGLGYIPGVTTG